MLNKFVLLLITSKFAFGDVLHGHQECRRNCYDAHCEKFKLNDQPEQNRAASMTSRMDKDGGKMNSTRCVGSKFTVEDEFVVNVKLLTAPTARLKSPVRIGIAPPSKTSSLTQLTPSNPNSSSTCMTPTNLRKTLTHLTQSDPANRNRSLIWTYGQASFFI